ncbi:MAG: LPS export ABC transporter periplasmic protein LptC [Phascolarctobacterium sp.]|nr:LPS export ABC transporter periplasmic protein LptC [Phascolarctobacterium sp.]
MKNNKAILAIVAGLLIAASLIAWLMLSGDKPTNVNLGKGVSAQMNASLKNSVLQREQDGRKLWEFTVAEVENDRKKNISYLKGIKGKVYRKDGSYLDIVADKGTAAINKNDFSLEGNVKAVLTSGGELYTDYISWNQKTEQITAKGHVKLVKDEYTAIADEATTTSAFEKLKLKGNAKVTKGGE